MQGFMFPIDMLVAKKEYFFCLYWLVVSHDEPISVENLSDEGTLQGVLVPLIVQSQSQPLIHHLYFMFS